MGRISIFPDKKTRQMPLYRVFCGMKARCYIKKAANYKYYGARGIKVCEEWKDNFKAFYEWAMITGYRKGLTIERINNDENYSPSNCKWATMQEQSENKRGIRTFSFQGESKSVANWAKHFGLSRYKVRKKLGILTNRYGNSV